MPRDAAEEELHMAMAQCPNGHIYDDRQHTRCPHCPIPGLGDVKQTEPASLRPGAGEPIRGGGSSDHGTTPSRTIGIYQKHEAFDPVVGWLVCVKGINKGRDYRLKAGRNKLGRAQNMDVCIEGDDTISRENHCEIAFDGRTKTFYVSPGDGRNLIYLNNEVVLESKRLQAYNRLELGDSQFVFIPLCSERFDWETSTDQKEPLQHHESKRTIEPPVI
jgi:hypothetical protein